MNVLFQISSAVAPVIANVALIVTIKFVGKRKLTVVSMFLTALMSVCLGVYVTFKEWLPSWLFIFLFTSVGFLNSLGASVPWLMLGEVFPVR